MKSSHLLHILIIVIISCILYPKSCYAFQEHGAKEGLYIHQLAHVCFGSAMLWLFFMIKKSAFWLKKWWKAIAIGGLGLAFWNVMTFVGHLLGPYNVYCHNESVTSNNGLFWLWYITKFDTVVCCLSMVFFYLGLRRLNNSITDLNSGMQKP